MIKARTLKLVAAGLALVALSSAARADGVASRDVSSGVVVEDAGGAVSRGIVSDRLDHRGAIVSTPQTMSADVEPRGRPNITIYVDPMSVGVNGSGASDQAEEGAASMRPRRWRHR